MQFSKLDNNAIENTLVAAAEGQVSSELAGEAVILNLETGKYYGLNPVGAHIWALLQEPRRISDLKAALLAEYDVTPDRCEQDLLKLLNDMAEHQLIKINGDTGA